MKRNLLKEVYRCVVCHKEMTLKEAQLPAVHAHNGIVNLRLEFRIDWGKVKVSLRRPLTAFEIRENLDFRSREEIIMRLGATLG